MIHDLELDIDFIRMPIIRNADGLALSSRNQYLSAGERTEALHLNRTLKQIEHMILANENYTNFINQQKLIHDGIILKYLMRIILISPPISPLNW